jgi:hypothetical protein
MIAWFVPMVIAGKMGPLIGLRPEESEGAQALLNAKFAGCAEKNIIGIAAVALAVCAGVSHVQTVAAATQNVPNPQEQSAAAASYGLSDLDAMTFSCPKAGLNAAAREAAKVPSEGTYQFAYFKIINDAHHATYEVHFESNYVGEPDLKYCVSMYCQQGWDPNTTKISVSRISDEPRAAGGAAHGTDCGNTPAPAKRN